ncbi:ATP-binding protein [Salegentibacter sediminis]|uniref:ATP-binding protein n=1 Tax=Salegentibacter sediminis TaxID=1930251 RepID=UPI0009BE613A|nr:tetratricopeptide repeat-containing sensor histidine kinase [Salegentibacter sediminis]
MTILRFSSLLIGLIVFVMCSCNRVEDQRNKNLILSDSSYIYFQKAQEAEKVQDKIKNLNKALAFVKNRHDSLYPKVLDFKVYYHNRLKQYDSSLFYANRLVDIAKAQNDTAYLATGYYRKAVVYRYTNQPEKTYENSLKSRKYYRLLGDSTSYARRTSEIAAAQHLITDYSGAQKTATEALRHFKQEDSTYISSTFNTIASSYRNQGLYEDALAEYKNALKYAVDTDDSLSAMNNIALSLRDLQRNKEALHIFEQILDRNKFKFEKSKARFIDNHAYTKWLTDSADVEEELLDALAIRKSINDLNGLVASYDHLSEYYKGRNREVAKAFADSLFQTAGDLGSKSAKLTALEKLIALSSQKEAKSLSSQYIRINDSLKAENLRAKNLFAKISYDEEEKLKQIDALEKRTLAQSLKTSDLEKQLITISFGASIILILVGFGIYHLNQRHQKEKLKEIYNTESRISKKIHDELANDIYNIMSKMESTASEEELAGLESIYSRTRNISRENRSIDTGENYLHNLTAMLTSNTSVNTRIILRGQEDIHWNKLATEKKIILYRILQELMINMKKYSGASLVAISFQKTSKCLTINYSDNGKGCSKEDLRNGNGIQNTENRIFSIGGGIIFEAQKGKGLKSSIKIPI